MSHNDFSDWMFSDLLARLRTPDAIPGMDHTAFQHANEWPVIRHTNVECYFCESDQLVWDVDAFPCIRPPFESMWMLSAGAEYVVTAQGRRRQEAGPIPTVQHVHSRQKDDGTVVVTTSMFIRYGKAFQPLAAAVFTADSQGSPASGNAKVPIIAHSWIPRALGLDEATLVNACDMIYKPMLLALSLMHCRNVSMQPSPPSRAVVRGSRGLVARERWHELAIGGITSKLDAERANGASLPKALHICRGSFATYSETAPLFGKYAGRYWRPAHVRGAKEAGEVHKTYSVRAGAR